MRFTHLQLQHFRNYDALDFTPHAGTTVLYGANGSGKTNILEAMHLLCLARSHRTANDKEMLQTQANMAIAKGETLRNDGKHTIAVALQSEQKPQKRVLLFGKPVKRIGELMGHATVVMFAPEDLRVVRDGPSARRRMVDMQLSKIRPSYFYQLKEYLQVLESRNALLKKQKLEGVADFPVQIATWDEQLVRTAIPIIQIRRWFLSTLSELTNKQYMHIASNPAEDFRIGYASAFATGDDVQQRMLDALQRHRREEMQRMYTVVGPHRDDMSMTLQGNDIRAFGSQGQLRCAVLSLKLAELQLIEEEMGEAPTLLLDDVFSELDAMRRNRLLESLQGVQTFITCTDKQDAGGAHADVFLQVTKDERGIARLS